QRQLGGQRDRRGRRRRVDRQRVHVGGVRHDDRVVGVAAVVVGAPGGDAPPVPAGDVPRGIGGGVVRGPGAGGGGGGGARRAPATRRRPGPGPRRRSVSVA